MLYLLHSFGTYSLYGWSTRSFFRSRKLYKLKDSLICFIRLGKKIHLTGLIAIEVEKTVNGLIKVLYHSMHSIDSIMALTQGGVDYRGLAHLAPY